MGRKNDEMTPQFPERGKVNRNLIYIYIDGQRASLLIYSYRRERCAKKRRQLPKDSLSSFSCRILGVLFLFSKGEKPAARGETEAIFISYLAESWMDESTNRLMSERVSISSVLRPLNSASLLIYYS